MLQPLQFISEPCSWFHTEDNYAQALIMESFSGIGLNRLGLYQECDKDPALRYFLMEYTLNQTGKTYHSGICYSSNCSATDLQYIAKSINQYIPLPFHNYRIFQPHTSAQTLNTFTLFFIVVLAIFVLPVLIASIAHFFKSKIKQQKTKKLIQFFSFQSSITYLFQKVSNNERIKVLPGLRAFAFLQMTLFNLTVALSQIPSSPEEPIVQKHFLHLYFSFDIWLMINGFYLSFELCRQWNKQKDIKYVFQTFARKTIKLVIISLISIICINYIVHAGHLGPLWTLTLQNFQNKFCIIPTSGCNFGLWVWNIQIIMCFLCCLLFLLYHSKLKYEQVLYALCMFLLFSSSFLLTYFFGRSTHYGKLQDGIAHCPLVVGLSYLLGFNFGILYYRFRASKQKPRLLVMRAFKYQSIRILTFFIAISIITFVYLYFIFLQKMISNKANQIIYQLFHFVVPCCYALLLLPEILGFENVVGALFRDKFMNIISKLSFCSYTLFYFVTLEVINSRMEDLYVNTAKVLCLWVCSIAISMLYGLILCILVELPLYRIISSWIGRSNSRAYIEFY